MKKLEPRFSMTREQATFVVRRNVVDYIWKSASLEGLTVTFPQTSVIFERMGIAGVDMKEIIAVNNLKRVWEFLIDNLDVPLDFNYICKINQIVGSDGLVFNAGYVRQLPVRMGGTTWIPETPIESIVREEFEEISKIENITERAITVMLWAMRRQIFVDGNKRTAMLAGNQILISHGYGVISIPIELQNKFRTMLIEFYESGDNAELMQFIYENCIDGMVFPE